MIATYSKYFSTINFRLLLIDGTILIAIFTVFVVGTLVWKPRLWLQDFPADIQALVPTKTASEKRLTTWIAIPFFTVLMGGLAVTAMRYGTANGFGALLFHIYLVWQMINLFDLIIIDWLGMQLVDPQNPPLPGTENAKGYRDYWFHFIGFLKGSALGFAVVLLIGGIVWFLP